MLTIAQQILQKYGTGYLLRQAAEECCELAQAALKVVRAEEKTTPMTLPEARESLIEEMADVQLMLDYMMAELISSAENRRLHNIMDEKEARMYRRLILDKEVEK